MGNVLLYVVLRAAAWLVVRLPLRLCYTLASAAATLAFVTVLPARRGLEANLSLAFPGLPAGVRRKIGMAAFQHDAMNWVDTLRIPALDPAMALGLIEVDHWELVDDAMAAGKGAVMAMVHVGNYDFVGQALAARGIQLSIPVERIQPERLYRFLVERRSAGGIRILPVEEASRPILQALRRGELVGIAADRLVGGKGVEVDFLSHRCEFPRGPAALARRTGAPLFVGVGIRRANVPFRGFIVPVEVPDTADARADEVEATQRLARLAESFVRAYPGQWLAFSPVCSRRHMSPNDPATIRRQTEPVQDSPDSNSRPGGER